MLKSTHTGFEYSIEKDYGQFWEIWFEHQPKLRNCCLRWLNGNHDSVEEALSQAVEKSHQYYLKNNEIIRSPFSWLCKVTYNICIDIHREQKKQHTFLNEMSDTPCQYFFAEYESEKLEDTVERDKKIENLNSALDRMRNDLKKVIYHRFIDEMEYSEIAIILDTTPENIRKRVQLARQELKSLSI